jgi:hypothetical protein
MFSEPLNIFISVDFPAPFFAEEDVDLPFLEIEIHLVERPHAGKALLDALRAQDERPHAVQCPPCRARRPTARCTPRR